MEMTALYALLGGILTMMGVFVVQSQKTANRHERRLTRVETKLDMLLGRNGISCSDDKKQARG